MSGGRATGSQQHENTTTDAALLALHLTHREATLLFAMAARHGATDSQIAHALRQGLPHLSDPDYFQDTSAGQQSEEKTDKDKGKHAAHKGKKKRKTVQAAQPQLPWLAFAAALQLPADAFAAQLQLPADAFAAALGAIPANDWWRTWAADRTIVLRMTSKSVKNAVDKLRPPAIVRLSRTFLDTVVCCKRGRLLHILTELEKMTSRCRITILDLENCGMSDQDAERLAGVLAQCPALAFLDLSYNCIGPPGAESLAGVLAQCPAQAHLDLSFNVIDAAGAGRLRASWRGQASCLLL